MDWQFMDGFRKPAFSVSWSAALQLRAAADRLVSSFRTALTTELAQWNARLDDLGADPSNRDWEQFRPLRLSREEDWSDWLAFLIEESTTGDFVTGLFPESAGRGTVTVTREEVIEAFQRRTDLIVSWGNGAFSHIEVKVGDENFDKNQETAEGAEAQYRGRGEPTVRRWYNYVLIPEKSLLALQPYLKNDDFTSTCLLWQDVARQLRRALYARNENATWLAFARAYIGAIEQKLLKLWFSQDESAPDTPMHLAKKLEALTSYQR